MLVAMRLVASLAVVLPLATLALAPRPVAARAPAAHREPLPTVEVVPTPRRRTRVLDVRGPFQVGAGWSTLHRAPVQVLSFEASVSLVELTDTTALHATLGESAVLSVFRDPDQAGANGSLGLDVGLGLSRYAPRGPAFFVTGTAGPRWDAALPDRLRPSGFGLVGKAEVYPFHASIPELVHDQRGWFRRFVLSGVSVWASARYDRLTGRSGVAWTGGLGLDVGRTLILPVLLAVDARRQRVAERR